MNSYKFGTSVKCSGTFRNESGALFDPAAIVFRVRRPDGTVLELTYNTDVALVRTGLGRFHTWVAADQVGIWTYGFKGDDNTDVTNDTEFTVEDSQIWNPPPPLLVLVSGVTAAVSLGTAT